MTFKRGDLIVVDIHNYSDYVYPTNTYPPPDRKDIVTFNRGDILEVLDYFNNTQELYYVWSPRHQVFTVIGKWVVQSANK